MKSRTEIRKAIRKMEEAREQVRLARITIEQAAEDLRIRSDRYEQGMEKTTDLLRAEVQLEEARMKRLQALYQYNISRARLELLLEKQL
jgi:outer membrane protein TolC